VAARQEVREVRISALVIGDAQVRIRGVDTDIDELVTSIRVHGLLEPIVVCPRGSDTFEVLAGQRRVLAYKKLGRAHIMAAIIPEPVDDASAKAISLTENIIRRDLDVRDVIDACTTLYKKYGSARDVADETGIPYAQVLKHLKYDRLQAPLKNKVDTGEVDLNIALKAQDAVATQDGYVDSSEALDLADALTTMNGAERRQILSEKKTKPERRVREILENFWVENEKDRQMVVTLPDGVHKALQLRAKQCRLTQDEFAARLICDVVSGWTENETD
jgi:ParB family chromosome partitioning protein